MLQRVSLEMMILERKQRRTEILEILRFPIFDGRKELMGIVIKF